MADFIKRKTADRNQWRRVTKKSYIHDVDVRGAFRGFISLLRIDEIAHPLYLRLPQGAVCIADVDFAWLGQFPFDGHHAVTTMFDAKGEVVQWYIDVCQNIHLDHRGVPCFEDLFLDIRVMPDGDCALLDEDELVAAFDAGVIDQMQYDLAYREAESLLDAIRWGEFAPFQLAKTHWQMLIERM
ncbi:DUF402 domain-containing protein [Alicyclobacillus acidoterrestris]|uniref:DUF402 domain-containing protein n=1 Tax=Alicyclobacillus acidoterrestris (strain ATCC 49025 / DSM 3922 / CIP 106132 / NCIMB 13137 / GD3B) TaxID=1356854 RepID=T0C910_ALIAG|nr:DUF402 domain-containing protein [Alicyclobacillus acidoterrestris]EPZ52663.1 hypothetical protein N007_19965 [Alicyclobacillus acidoterrestris ATCC 49025]UNO48620.1 DUF402 domain-containing protein [Alicyclobacillus acidoterrestris]